MGKSRSFFIKKTKLESKKGASNLNKKNCEGSKSCLNIETLIYDRTDRITNFYILQKKTQLISKTYYKPHIHARIF